MRTQSDNFGELQSLLSQVQQAMLEISISPRTIAVNKWLVTSLSTLQSAVEIELKNFEDGANRKELVFLKKRFKTLMLYVQTPEN